MATDIRRLISILLVSALAMACSETLDGEYSLNVPSNTAPNIRITKVTITKDATVIRLSGSCPNTNPRSYTLGVYPPGHQMAFYIMSTDRSKKFNLVDIEDVPIRPDFIELSPGESTEFTLTFERVDDDMNHFHLIEGEAESTSERPWHFLNVSLPVT